MAAIKRRGAARHHVTSPYQRRTVSNSDRLAFVLSIITAQSVIIYSCRFASNGVRHLSPLVWIVSLSPAAPRRLVVVVFQFRSCSCARVGFRFPPRRPSCLSLQSEYVMLEIRALLGLGLRLGSPKKRSDPHRPVPAISSSATETNSFLAHVAHSCAQRRSCRCEMLRSGRNSIDLFITSSSYIAQRSFICATKRVRGTRREENLCIFPLAVVPTTTVAAINFSLLKHSGGI